MPHLTLQISPNGLLLDVQVGVSVPRANALRRLDQQVPPPVLVRGLVDTGASGTCIDPELIQRLQLQPTGQAPIHTPSTGSTPHPMTQYDVSVSLLHPQVRLNLNALAVIESSQRHCGYHLLIGRDVLAQCLLVYDGRAGLFSLAF